MIKITKKYTELIAILIILIISGIAVYIFYDLGNADLKIPFSYYGGDGILLSYFVKTIKNTGWYLTNPFVGMPFGGNVFDFPVGDTFHFFILKLLVLMFSDFGMAINIYFLLLFPITAIITFYVLRHFKISGLISTLSGLTYSFLSYRFLRGEMHLFLSAFYIVPLTVMLVLWIYLEDDFLIIEDARIKYNYNKKFTVSIIICILTATSGIYYAFFGCFLVVIAGISRFIKSKKVIFLYKMISVVSFIALISLLNLLPNILYSYKYGPSTEVAYRNPIEAEIYGMKITQLFIPINTHGLAVIERLKGVYAHAPLPNEGSEYLGIIGIIGFVILILFLMNKGNDKSHGNNILNVLSELNIFSILLATIGGFGSIFALVISAKIRGYNRISVYIAFFSIFSFAIIMDTIYAKLPRLNKSIFAIFLILLTSISIYDQIPNNIIDHSYLKNIYYNDKEFVERIEDELEYNAMIFQLPYYKFPESPPMNNMGDYELFRGYLHSDNLKWSYGGVKGRESDLWLREVSTQPLGEMIETIVDAGFSGIYIARNAYTEEEIQQLEYDIKEILNIEPIESSNESEVFYNMSQYIRNKNHMYTADNKEQRRIEALSPTYFNWIDGFSGLEGTEEANWRWCSNEGTIEINNTSMEIKEYQLEMDVYTGYKDNSELIIEVNADTENKYTINSDGMKIIQKVSIVPGKSKISFRSDAKQLVAPDDPRALIFRICNFKYSIIK